MLIRRYSELIKLPTFEERFNYLKVGAKVGFETFGPNRYICQRFYQYDPEWLSIRNEIITRDHACDLALPGYDIASYATIHHLNPITLDDIINRTPMLLDPENLICVSSSTHRAIHYTNDSILAQPFADRRPGDTRLW